MAQQFAVMHTEKGSGSGGGLGHHIDRSGEREIYFPHANPELKDLNVHIKTRYSDLSLADGIGKRISEGYQGKRKIRTDAVKFLKTVLTGSHEQMIKLQKEGLLNDWVKANIKFMKDEFGADNFVRFTLHLDEKTPHLHAVHVPLTDDGRLSAKEIMGNKIHLQKRQDRYAAAMSSFGLERGIRNTGVTHTDTQDYYNEVQSVSEDVSNLIVKGLLGVDKGKTIDNLRKSLKTAQIENRMLKEKYANQAKKLQANSLFKRDLQGKIISLVDRVKKLNGDVLYLVKHPEKYQELREAYLNEQKNDRNRGLKR